MMTMPNFWHWRPQIQTLWRHFWSDWNHVRHPWKQDYSAWIRDRTARNRELILILVSVSGRPEKLLSELVIWCIKFLLIISFVKIFPKEINGYNSILSTSLFIAFILMRQNVDFQHGWIDCRKVTFAAGRFVDYVDFPRAGRSGFHPSRLENS